MFFAETERRIRANDPDYNTAFLYAVSSLNSSKSLVRYIATAAAAVADWYKYGLLEWETDSLTSSWDSQRIELATFYVWALHGQDSR